MKPHPKKKKRRRLHYRAFSKMCSSSLKLLKNLRWSSMIMGFINFGVVVLGLVLMSCGFMRSCTRTQLVPFWVVLFASGLRIFAMFRCAVEQQAAAIAILGSSPASSPGDDGSVLNTDYSRCQRRLRYRRWVWWTRFSTVITVLQFLLAAYLVFVLARISSLDNSSDYCGVGQLSSKTWWNNHLINVFLIVLCFVAILQCFASSDVLRWRSFYDVHDNAWKAHYQEVFDHGIREALCCLGRFKYLKTMDKDEVYSVAQLLGDLVTYRASGTGHLELLAGLALLQSHNQCPKLDESCAEAPEDKIQEAIALHPFAEAAYTGPLLDVGRSLILFPCVWLHRQGVLTAWSRNRRPRLEGDNWWRGHAAAFLKYVNLPAESLRRGRVNQGKCQAAYFIVVLHHIRSVVIAVRGTETPEDLIIDGMCRETALTAEDIDGLINGRGIDSDIRQKVLSTFPHYGHSGIVDAARELYNQIEGSNSGDHGFETGGFLSSLLGGGRECQDYAVRIVGHSLGGAIAALLGIRLRGRFPDLHVYAYGPLPCVDSVLADACSSFMTSIVHDSEFSSYLSINSILRLRAAALTTMSQGGSTDSAMVSKLAHLFLYLSKYQIGNATNPTNAADIIAADTTQSLVHDPDSVNLSITSEGECSYLHDECHIREIGNEIVADELSEDRTNPFTPNKDPAEDPVSRFLEGVPSSVSRSTDDPPEVFLPGFIIHLIQLHRGFNFPMWKGWGVQGRQPSYKAVIADKENFKDILISPYMFLDHLPWRCQSALQNVLEFRNAVNHDRLQIV